MSATQRINYQERERQARTELLEANRWLFKYGALDWLRSQGVTAAELRPYEFQRWMETHGSGPASGISD